MRALDAPASRLDPVLADLRQTLRDMYGPRLEKAVLFGSRARGEARPDSDYDVAVFLTPPLDRFAELDRLADIGTDLLYTHGRVVHAQPFAAPSLTSPDPLMRAIRAEGIAL
jgi:predicted nucleotidyltransferase